MWECYERTKKKCGKDLRSGYIRSMNEIWDGRDIEVRTMNGLVKQASSIRKGKFLLELEKKEIEDQVNGRKGEVIGKGDEGGNIEDEDHVEETEFTVAQRCEETENRRVDYIRIMDRGQVNIARVDAIKADGKVRILDENEKGLLGKVREVYLKAQDESISTLKAVDKRKVREESEMVNRILHKCLEDKMDVTKVNRLLYAGAWVFTEELGMIAGKVGDAKRKEKKKPHWNQRTEKSVGEWRKDLGRVEELKKSEKLNDEAAEKLDKKYSLLEKGSFW